MIPFYSHAWCVFLQYLLNDEEELIVRGLFKERFVRERQSKGEA